MGVTCTQPLRYRQAEMPTQSRRSRIPTTLVGILGAILVAYGLYHRTRWFREGNQLFYRDRRPNRAGRAFGDFWVAVNRRGVGPDWMVSLETVGHRTGRRSSLPLVLADHGGARYAVSMFGERSPWVHNLRAADGRAVIRHGAPRDVRLVEVPAAERAPILKAYLARAAGGRPHIPVDKDAPLEAFEAIAADFPVFRVEDPEAAPSARAGTTAGAG
jgi:deazaflavin-dependent oxidoreductase (nitroreductase family)